MRHITFDPFFALILFWQYLQRRRSTGHLHASNRGALVGEEIRTLPQLNLLSSHYLDLDFTYLLLLKLSLRIGVWIGNEGMDEIYECNESYL